MKGLGKCRLVWMWAIAALLAGSVSLWAQEAAQPKAGEQPSGRRSGRGGGPGGGGFDRAAMEERMMTGLRDRLGATEEEWKAIEPLLKTVMEKQRAARSSEVSMFALFMRPEGGGGRGGEAGQSEGGRGGRKGGESGQPTGDRGNQPGGDRGGRGGPGGFFSQEQSPEVEALSKTLENASATPDEIKAKLEALRSARTKQQDDLKKAREALREVLNARQEAQLTLVGILD